MLSVGQLLWASFRPLIRLYALNFYLNLYANHDLSHRVLCASSGFILTKTDNFPAVAARGAAQIMLNIALPCLMFSKIVSAFSSDHISALGMLRLSFILLSQDLFTSFHFTFRPTGARRSALRGNRHHYRMVCQASLLGST